MNIQMGIELDHQSPFLACQHVVDGQGAEMIAAQPDQEITLAEDATSPLSALVPPSRQRLDRFKSGLTQPNLVAISVGAGRRRLAARVLEDFAHSFGEKVGALARAAAAK